MKQRNGNVRIFAASEGIAMAMTSLSFFRIGGVAVGVSENYLTYSVAAIMGGFFFGGNVMANRATSARPIHARPVSASREEAARKSNLPEGAVVTSRSENEYCGMAK